MERRRVMGVAGAVGILLGVAAPLVEIESAETVGLTRLDPQAAGILVALGVAALVVSLGKAYALLWAVAPGAALAVALELWQLESRVAALVSREAADVSVSVAGGAGSVMQVSARMRWGWVALLIGVLLLFAAAAVRDEVDEDEDGGDEGEDTEFPYALPYEDPSAGRRKPGP